MKKLAEIKRNILPIDSLKSPSKYCAGNLMQSIYGSVLDNESGRAYNSHVYICERNILLQIYRYSNSKSHIIYQLGETDNFKSIKINPETLKSVVNQIGTSKALKINSTSPLCGVLINRKLLFICGITGTTDIHNWILKKYLVSKDYCIKTTNTITQFNNILLGNGFDKSLKTHGLDQRTAYINQYLTIALLIIFLPTFCYLLYISTKDNPLLFVIIVTLFLYIMLSNRKNT